MRFTDTLPTFYRHFTNIIFRILSASGGDLIFQNLLHHVEDFMSETFPNLRKIYNELSILSVETVQFTVECFNSSLVGLIAEAYKSARQRVKGVNSVVVRDVETSGKMQSPFS